MKNSQGIRYQPTKLGSLQPALVLHPAARADDAAPLHPTEGNEATSELSLQSNVAHGAGAPAAHAIDEADAHHLPPRVAQEAAAKHSAEEFKPQTPTYSLHLARLAHSHHLARFNPHTRIRNLVSKFTSNAHRLEPLQTCKRSALDEYFRRSWLKTQFVTRFVLIRIRSN